MGAKKGMTRGKALLLVTATCLALSLWYGRDVFKGDDDATPLPPSAAERQVSDDAQVTVYIEGTNREFRQYKLRFLIKKPGNPLIAPILRMAGAPDAHSVVVSGVALKDADFAFSPNIAVFDINLQAMPANYNTRALNGDVMLCYAYRELIAKYETGM